MAITVGELPRVSDDPVVVRSAAPSRVWLTRIISTLLQLLLVMFATVTVLFFLLRAAGDPALIIGGELATAEDLDRIRQFYGLDQSIVVQYLTYLRNAFSLDFGTSLVYHQDALDLVFERLGSTLLLAGLGVAFSTVISLVIGIWLGARSESRFAPALRATVLLSQGIPGYVFALVSIQIFSVTFRLLPSIASQQPISWVLPVLALAFLLAPRLILVLAASVSEGLREDYVRTARGLGARESTVLFRHVLPNAAPGAVAVVALQLGSLLSGAMIIEVIFGWGGLGRLLVESVLNLDFPVVQAAVLVVVALVFILTSGTDLVLSFVDPRRRAVR